MHSNRIASFEFVVRGWLRALRLTAFAQGHSTRRAMLLQPCLQLAARSVVMREALVKAESSELDVLINIKCGHAAGSRHLERFVRPFMDVYT